MNFIKLFVFYIQIYRIIDQEAIVLKLVGYPLFLEAEYTDSKL